MSRTTTLAVITTAIIAEYLSSRHGMSVSGVLGVYLFIRDNA